MPPILKPLVTTPVVHSASLIQPSQIKYWASSADMSKVRSGPIELTFQPSAGIEHRCGFWRSPSPATRNPVRQTGSRPAAPKNLGFPSAYVFAAVCPSEGMAAALTMPICNTVAMNHHSMRSAAKSPKMPMPW